MAGRCVTGTLQLGGVDAGAALSGTYTSFADGAILLFSASPDGATGAVARFQLAGATETVTVKLTSATAAEMNVGGLVITGNGTPTATAQTQLAALAASPLARMMALAVLELGCRSESIEPVELAALVFPWQVLLKYTAANRGTEVQALAAQSACGYFRTPQSSGAAPVPSLLGLSFDDPVPNVFGYFPLDQLGALEVASSAKIKLSGSPTGPCGALCRGACGPDCTLNNCKLSSTSQCVLSGGRNTGDWQVGLIYTCGTHQGCREHDDCYDICNEARCNSWAAACCRRACDIEATRFYPTEATYWARGYGTFDGKLQFTFWDPPEYLPGFCPVDRPAGDAASLDARDAGGVPDQAPATPDVARAGTEVARDLPADPATTDLPVVNTWQRGAFELVFEPHAGCATLDTQSDGLVKVTTTCQIGSDGLAFTQTDTFQWTPPPAQMAIAETGASYDALWWESGTMNVSSVLSTTNVGQPPRACVSQRAWQTSHPTDTYATGVGATPCSSTQPAAVIPLKARDAGAFHADFHAGSPPPAYSPVVYELSVTLNGASAGYYRFFARYTYAK